MELDDCDETNELEIISRKGYKLKDLAKTFLQTLGESGPIASGKIIHLTSDI